MHTLIDLDNEDILANPLLFHLYTESINLPLILSDVGTTRWTIQADGDIEPAVAGQQIGTTGTPVGRLYTSLVESPLTSMSVNSTLSYVAFSAGGTEYLRVPTSGVIGFSNGSTSGSSSGANPGPLFLNITITGTPYKIELHDP